MFIETAKDVKLFANDIDEGKSVIFLPVFK